MATGATEYHLHRSDIGTREGHDVRGYFQSTASERNPRNLTLLECPIQSVEFYRRVFGFETIDTDQNEGVTDETRLCAMRAGDGSALLLFKKSATADTNATGAIHVAFGIFRSELPAWEAWLSQQGITIELRKTWKYGGEALYFRDPDGHLLEVVTPGVWSIYRRSPSDNCLSFRHSTHTPGTGAPPDGLSAILKLSFCDLVVAPVESNSIGQSSQVQTSADYAKLSLAGAKAIMLAPKEVHPQLGASLCIKAHSALLAVWIESNILLQLASAPFDKQDETLVPEAGSCANCPKRTGFNKLLFPDVRKDSCTSPDCFRAKIDACVKKTLETKPQLVQISAAWNSREGAPLGRNDYLELEIR
jgi:catechol 2,3-dioxygenase-like lactoylglutathione lyase family enzyme